MIDRNHFFESIKDLFHHLTQGQVDGLNSILDAWEKNYSDKPSSYLAYCLATVYHETATTMQPIKEYGSGRGRKYGVKAGPYFLVYYGRGYVQMTWLDNYKNATDELNHLYNLNIDLVKNPDDVLKPEIAAPIMFQGMIDGWFTGKKLSDYFGVHEDPINARRIINGIDKANTIAGYYKYFKEALRG